MRELTELTDCLRDELRSLKAELTDKSSRLETALSDRAQLQGRVSRDGANNEEERTRALDQLAKMTGSSEQLQTDLKNLEERYAATLTELEKTTILSKDREKRIHNLTEEARKTFFFLSRMSFSGNFEGS